MCNNGDYINSTCICYSGYSSSDDFYVDLKQECQIDTNIRFVIIYILLAIGCINTVVCSTKLLISLRHRERIINMRLVNSMLLTLSHYLCVVIMCYLLQNNLMNQYLGTLITGSFAFLLGCVEQSAHLIEVLIIFSRSIADLRKSITIIKLRTAVTSISYFAGINWMLWSLISYSLGYSYTFLVFMWLGLTLATFVWAICFGYYGTQVLNEIKHSHIKMEFSQQVTSLVHEHVKVKSIDIVATSAYTKLRNIIYSYSAISIGICIGSLLIINVKAIYSRTFYIYGIMGTILGIVDLLYITNISIIRPMGATTDIERSAVVEKTHSAKMILVEQTKRESPLSLQQSTANDAKTTHSAIKL